VRGGGKDRAPIAIEPEGRGGFEAEGSLALAPLLDRVWRGRPPAHDSRQRGGTDGGVLRWHDAAGAGAKPAASVAGAGASDADRDCGFDCGFETPGAPPRAPAAVTAIPAVRHLPPVAICTARCQWPVMRASIRRSSSWRGEGRVESVAGAPSRGVARFIMLRRKVVQPDDGPGGGSCEGSGTRQTSEETAGAPTRSGQPVAHTKSGQTAPIGESGGSTSSGQSPGSLSSSMYLPPRPRRYSRTQHRSSSRAPALAATTTRTPPPPPPPESEVRS
jgi:hypothetical protein